MDTVIDIQNRLKLGEVYKVQTDTFSYTLYREGKRYILVQAGSKPTHFRSLEEAILTLLSCIGKFEEREERA
jgi:hypothetical protein